MTRVRCCTHAGTSCLTCVTSSPKHFVYSMLVFTMQLITQNNNLPLWQILVKSTLTKLIRCVWVNLQKASQVKHHNHTTQNIQNTKRNQHQKQHKIMWLLHNHNRITMLIHNQTHNQTCTHTRSVVVSHIIITTHQSHSQSAVNQLHIYEGQMTGHMLQHLATHHNIH